MQALNAALKIFYNVKQLIGENKRDVNIGLGFGECMMCHVGGIFNRQMIFSIGESVSEAQ